MKKLLGATVAATAIALCVAPTASADIIDDAYLYVLHQKGIGHVDGDSGLITAGHEICGKLDAGYSVTEAGAYVHNMSGMTGYNSGYLVGAAVSAYCPEYGYQIDALAPQRKYLT